MYVEVRMTSRKLIEKKKKEKQSPRGTLTMTVRRLSYPVMVAPDLRRSKRVNDLVS